MEQFNGSLGRLVQASVCVPDKSVCVCQVVITKDRNIGSPAVLTCLQGTFYQLKHSHELKRKRNFFQPTVP